MSIPDEPILLDPRATEEIRDRFSRWGIELQRLCDPHERQVDRIVEGAGELAAELGGDDVRFRLSWLLAFEAGAQTSGRIAANVGGFSLDLRAVDLDLS